MGSDDGRIPFRVRVGAVGHRDLHDRDRLTGVVRERLVEIRALFGAAASTPVVFVVLSALAEGADLLVAREAIDLFAPGELQLHAVLPMGVESYRTDFATPQELDELLTVATACTEMPAAADREESFERAGRFVVDHSDVLIALWDGYPAEGRGGTAEIVGYARKRGVGVLVVPTVRAGRLKRAPRDSCGGERSDGCAGTRSDSCSGVRSDGCAGAVRPGRARDGELAALLAAPLEAFARIRAYNRLSLQDPRLQRRLREAERRLERVAHSTGIVDRYARVAAWALPHLVRADALALRYQRWYKRLGESLYLLAALAVTVVAVQSQFGGPAQVVLLEVAFMLALLGLYLVARRLRLQDRWLGYRSLAEAFRSALFIAMSGTRERHAGDGLLGAGEQLTPWYQRAFSEAWSHRPALAEEPSSVARLSGAAGLQRFLLEAWVESQIAYHRDAAGRFHRSGRRLTRSVFALFGATVVIGCLHAFEVVGGSFWTHLLVALTIALPGFGAALTGIRDLRQYRLHEGRSLRTAERLEQLVRGLDSRRSPVSAYELVAETQAVIQAENHDWSGVIEFQALEIVI